MNDPKYTITEGAIHHIEGGYALPGDEPLMLFRGKDALLPELIEWYRDRLTVELHQETMPSRIKVIQDHLATSAERLAAVQEFQANHPERVGVACCSRVAI